MEKLLITGSAGFIGMHLCENLLKDKYIICGIDNMNDYYDPSLKEARLNNLLCYENFNFIDADISDLSSVESIFKEFNPDKVVNLAAQAGVRYSLENPHAYIKSNVEGFMNILEGCRHNKVEGLIYASSSSVYGGNKDIPFSESHSVDSPLSIYACSKKSNELMAYSYTHLYGLNTTGLRFFTVYGPWGRPDMAMYIFTEKILKGEPISVFNHGNMERDFTYIDDIIKGIRAAINRNYKYEIFNLGNSQSEDLLDMISTIENNIGKKAKRVLMEIQPGDVKKTFADISHSKDKLGFNPETSISAGIPLFIEWYKSYKKSNIENNK